ncbi:MAG: amidohydrolase family protein [Clostridiales bacterium]|nr:amidohydrolase family protein [Clostridiales bacterium]
MRKVLSIIVALALLFAFTMPIASASGVATVDKKVFDSYGKDYTANNAVTRVTDYVTLRTDAKDGWFVEVCDAFVGTVEIAYKVGSSYYTEVIEFDGTKTVYRFGDGSGKNGVNSVKFGKTVVMNPAADLVLYNGVVQTMDDNRSFATAVAVSGDKIVYVGNDVSATLFIGEGTQVRNLAGQMVLPGFIDSHGHAPGMYASNVPSLFYVEPTLAAVTEHIQNYIYANPNATGYWFNHLNVSIFADYKAGFPDKEWLDQFDTGATAKPIFCQDIAWHSWVVNSKAMERANEVRANDITQNMPRTSGYYAHLDADGWPTGYFVDGMTIGLGYIKDGNSRNPSVTGIRNNANQAYTVDLTYNTQSYFNTAWFNYQKEANSYGITGFSDASGNWLRVGTEFRDFVRNGTLTLRVNIPSFIDHDSASNHTRTAAQLVNTALTNTDGWETGVARKNTLIQQNNMSDWVSATAVKLYIDGVTEGGTAYMLEPYAETANLYEQIADPDYRGYSMWGDQKIKDMVALIDAAGYAVHMHCLGDAAVKLAVEAVMEAQDANGTKGQIRHIIAHAPYVDASDMDNIREYGIIVNLQPIWMFSNPWFSPLELKTLGQERVDRVYPIKDMVEKGIIMTASSDYDVSLDFAPLSGIEVGMTRTSPYSDTPYTIPEALFNLAGFSERVVRPAALFGSQDDPKTTHGASQAVSLMSMLEMYTRNGAYQMCQEDKFGTLEAGKFADLVILEKDLFKVAPKDISEVKVMATMVGGKFVFENQ